jgi:hypothetical protein
MENKSKSNTLLLERCILSFSHIFEPHKSMPTAKEKYSANFIVDPNTPKGKAAIKLIEAEILRVEKEVFGRTGVTIPDPKRRCWFKGDEVINQKSGEVVDGYAGMMVLKASRAVKNGPPQIVDANPKVRLKATDNRPLSGDIVNAMIQIYGIPASDKNRGGLGLFATIEVVQYVAEGKRFGGGPVINAEESLPNVEEVEDEV